MFENTYKAQAVTTAAGIAERLGKGGQEGGEERARGEGEERERRRGGRGERRERGEGKEGNTVVLSFLLRSITWSSPTNKEELEEACSCE